MKNRPSIFSLLLIFVWLTSCNEGGNESGSAEEADENKLLTETPSSAGTESQEEEVYKIPPAIDTTISVEIMGSSMEDMRYSPGEIRVPANARVKVILKNNAEDPDLLHNIVFVKKNSQELVANLGKEAGKDNAFVPDHPAVFAGSEIAEPGETVELLFTAPHQSGEYAFISTYPGQRQEMNGRFIVETVADL